MLNYSHYEVMDSLAVTMFSDSENSFYGNVLSTMMSFTGM